MIARQCSASSDFMGLWELRFCVRHTAKKKPSNRHI